MVERVERVEGLTPPRLRRTTVEVMVILTNYQLPL